MLSLPERVRSPLSVNALPEDFQVSHKTANAWLDALERLYAIFRLPAFGAAPRLRAIKKGRKHYHFDWTVVPEHGPRFENLTACHLLKWVHHQQDTEGLDIELRYFRDRDGAGKSTSSSSSRVFHRFSSNANGPIPPPDRGIKYLKARFPDAEAWQISATRVKDYVTPDWIRVAPALVLRSELV